ncbi:MAG TPA: LLM class flavin-dependent oxidoreductase, partial [Thermomicrobiales bacterium]|nr:LLM class flavin-dependent oxidoreductase [Thermomicrobiales bacterium]
SLGVRGPKSLEAAGRCADGTILAENSAPAYVSWAREHIARGTSAAGRNDHHRLTVYANAVVSATDPARAASRARAASAAMLGGEANAQTFMLPYADDLARVAREGPKAYRDEWLDDLAIAGSPEQGVAAIQRLAAAGADAIVVVPPVGTDYDAWLEDVANLVSPRR